MELTHLWDQQMWGEVWLGIGSGRDGSYLPHLQALGFYLRAYKRNRVVRGCPISVRTRRKGHMLRKLGSLEEGRVNIKGVFFFIFYF